MVKYCAVRSCHTKVMLPLLNLKIKPFRFIVCPVMEILLKNGSPPWAIPATQIIQVQLHTNMLECAASTFSAMILTKCLGPLKVQAGED